MFRNDSNTDSVKLKCKYYGYTNFSSIDPAGKKFPFNDNEELRKLGSDIIKYQKSTRKSFRDLNINIDKDVLNIVTKKSNKLVYNFRSNKHYNPWSCLVYAESKKMMVIMALTRDNSTNLIVTCDTVKILDSKKKINNFINIYKKYFIKTSNIQFINLDSEFPRDLHYYNLQAVDVTNLQSIDENTEVEEFYDNPINDSNNVFYDNPINESDSVFYDDAPNEEDIDNENGYMEIGSIQINNDNEPLIQ